jgi:hypothetical protein
MIELDGGLVITATQTWSLITPGSEVLEERPPGRWAEALTQQVVNFRRYRCRYEQAARVGVKELENFVASWLTLAGESHKRRRVYDDRH